MAVTAVLLLLCFGSFVVFAGLALLALKGYRDFTGIRSKSSGSIGSGSGSGSSNSGGSGNGTYSGPSTVNSGAFAFSPAKALAELNSRRAQEGLKHMVLDGALMSGAQARADKGSYPHVTNDYLNAGACECLSYECKGSGDDVMRWAITKLWDFEKSQKQGAFAPGSPCYATVPTDAGHYKILSGRGGCAATRVGFGLNAVKQFNGAPPPSFVTHLVVIWVK